MIIVEGYVRMENPGDFETVRAAAEAQIAASRAEDGCIDYTYALDRARSADHARAGALEELGSSRSAFRNAAYASMARRASRREVPGALAQGA